jgi:hypothetical protein
MNNGNPGECPAFIRFLYQVEHANRSASIDVEKEMLAVLPTHAEGAFIIESTPHSSEDAFYDLWQRRVADEEGSVK